MHLPVFDGLDNFFEKKKSLLSELSKNKVDKGIVIADSVEKSTIGNTDQCLSLFEDCDNIFVVAGLSPKENFKAQTEKVKKYFLEEKIVGVKLFPDHENFRINDKSLFPFFGRAEEHKCPVLFHSEGNKSLYSKAHMVKEVLENFPNLKLICCHCFYPDLENCLDLLSYENLYFDISSIADNEKLQEKVRKPLISLIKLAANRVIFGSDFGACSQKDHIDFLKSLPIDENIKEKIFSKNASLLYNLK